MKKIPRLLPLIAIAIGGVVLLRFVGIAPDLFQGARAWAEEALPGEAATAVAAAAPAAAVCALTPEQLADQADISPAELRIIQRLLQRREELDARDQEFATMLPLLVAAEQKVDAKLQELTIGRGEVQALLGQASTREQEEINRLVQVYSAMRPREAAPVMASLADSVRLPVAAAMRPRTLAAIMAQMTPAQARELTEKLARRFEAQQLAARAAAAGTPPPEAAPGAAAPAPAAAAPTQTAANTASPPTTTPAPASTPAAQPAAQPAAAARNRPAAQPAVRRPAAQPARRPAQQASRPPAASSPPPAESSGPRPYQASEPSAAAANRPRQSVD